MAAFKSEVKKSARRAVPKDSGNGHLRRIGGVVVHDVVPVALWFVKAAFVGLVGFLATIFIATTLVRELGVFLAQTSGLAADASVMMWVLGFVGPYFFVILMMVVALCCCMRGLWRGVGQGCSFVASRLAVWYDGRDGKGSSDMTSEVEAE